jgi:transcriptional regulator with XRE-family HTH domain
MGLGLTQEQFSEKISVSRTYLQTIEAGRGNPTIKVAAKIRKVAGCSWDQLFTGC